MITEERFNLNGAVRAGSTVFYFIQRKLCWKSTQDTGANTKPRRRLCKFTGSCFCW